MSTREPTWFERSAWAANAWKDDEAYYWQTVCDKYGTRADPAVLANALAWVEFARTSCRRLILGWWRKLCLPMKFGECTPHECAELLAESWDHGKLREEFGS